MGQNVQIKFAGLKRNIIIQLQGFQTLKDLHNTGTYLQACKNMMATTQIRPIFVNI